MADTIYLPDGTTEVIFGDPMDTITRLVLERLGPDAERIIKKYAADLQEQQEDLEGEMRSYEGTVESQRDLLQDTLDSLRALLPDIKSRKVAERVTEICENIYKNL